MHFTKIESKKNMQFVALAFYYTHCVRLGVKVRNMKMDLNIIYGTWRQGTFEKLIMEIYDFFL